VHANAFLIVILPPKTDPLVAPNSAGFLGKVIKGISWKIFGVEPTILVHCGVSTTGKGQWVISLILRRRVTQTGSAPLCLLIPTSTRA
jgi:hypothetical protein